MRYVLQNKYISLGENYNRYYEAEIAMSYSKHIHLSIFFFLYYT